MAWRGIGVATLVLFTAACSGSDDGKERITGGGSLHTWVQSVRDKVQPTTAPTDQTSVSLVGPRKSYQSSQIVVTSDEKGGLLGVQATPSDLTDGEGHTIAASNLTLFREYFIDFEKATEATGGSEPVPEHSKTRDTKIPDPLIPLESPEDHSPLGQPFDVPKELNQPLWLDVYIPEGTPAGTYQGEVTLTDESGQSSKVPVSLEVWDLDLPDMTSITSWFIFRIDSLVDYHSGTADCSSGNCWLDWTERPRTIVKRYEELAHQHRIDTGVHFIHSPNDGCNPPTEFAQFDEEMQPYMDGSYFADGVPSTRFEVGFTPGTDEWGYGAGCSDSEYAALAKAWASHLKEKGWFERAYIYALDEPPESAYPQIAEDSARIQAGDPDWKRQIILTTTPTFEYADLLNPAVGIYDINPPYFSFTEDPNTVDSHVEAYGRFSVDQLFEQGIRIWFYESCSVVPPSPTFGTNTLDGAEPQMLMWGSWFERASGFLFWGINAWDKDDPWGTNHEAYSKTGDGVLVYPGNHDGENSPHGSPEDVSYDGPIPSYRLKMIRQGMQDWSLFDLADKLGLGGMAREQVAEIYGQFHGCDWQGCAPPISGFYWKTDVAKMDEIRKNIADAIIEAE